MDIFKKKVASNVCAEENNRIKALEKTMDKMMSDHEIAINKMEADHDIALKEKEFEIKHLSDERVKRAEHEKNIKRLMKHRKLTGEDFK